MELSYEVTLKHVQICHRSIPDNRNTERSHRPLKLPMDRMVFSVFSSSGGSGTNSGVFTGASDIGNPAWGFFASGNETSEALYDISGGALTVGQTLSFDIDNGGVGTGGVVGVGLQNISNANNRFEFLFVGGDSNYVYNDNSGGNDSGIGFTDSGLAIDFTLTGTNTYSLDVKPSGSTTSNFTGTLGGTAGSGVDRIRFFNFNAGSTSNEDFLPTTFPSSPNPPLS